MKLSKRQVIQSLGAAGAAALGSPALSATRGAATPRVTISIRSPFPPVQRAAQDLAGDLKAVLGASVDLVQDQDQAHDGLHIAIATSHQGARESFSLSRRGHRVDLVGADMRGTIYAIYQFSQDHLGVDPMAFWTDHIPKPLTEIAMKDGARITFPGPVIDHRGFFVNDEDQLTGWAPAKPEDRTNIDPAVMDKVYETILRLKGNMVVPSTWPFADDPQIKAASARGLIVNQHHATPVGMNAARWPEHVPYNYTEHPDILRNAWKNSIALYDKDQEVLWTVGMRGLSDVSYASMDPSVVGNKPRMGQLAGQAMREQMELVRARFPNARFVTNLWSEGAELMREGHLKIPEEVIIAWPDEGWGKIRDDGQVSKDQGFYFHVAMLNGKANQLSEMVPVERIHEEFGRFIRAGATRFALVNVSDLRAVAMTAKATLDTAWNGVPARTTARSYYAGWAKGQYGAAAAESLADFYPAYFKGLPRLPTGEGTGGGMEYGDQRYQELSRSLMLRTMIDPPYYRTIAQSPQWWPPRMVDYGKSAADAKLWVDQTSAREIATCTAAQPRFDALLKQALAILPQVAPERRDYFQYAVLTMLSVNRNGNAMLLAVSHAAKAARAGNQAEALSQADAALAQIAEIRRYETYATYGKWKNWWRGEWLTNIESTADWLATFKKWVMDPIGTTPVPIMETDWEAYYRILKYQGTRSVDVRP